MTGDQKICLMPQRVSLFGEGKAGETTCSIHGLYKTQDGLLKDLPMLLIQMGAELNGFSLKGNSENFKTLCEFVDGIFDVLLKATDSDVDAKQHIEAIRRIVFANQLGIEKTKIAQVIKWRTIPSAKAHAFLWFDLIRKLTPIIEPLDVTKDFAGDRIRLRDELPDGHGLVKAARRYFPKGRGNTTAQSLAYQIYLSLMRGYEIKRPNLKDLENGLKEFLRDRNIRDADSTGYIQQLKIEGFDYYAILGGKGFNTTVG